MEEEELGQLLLDYAATASNPSYGGDWNVIDAKFPEFQPGGKYQHLKAQDLHDYVETYNNPEYKQDTAVINAKFPEFFATPGDVKKKDQGTPLSPSTSALDGTESSLESPQVSEEERFGLGSVEDSDTYPDLVLRGGGTTPIRRKFGELTYQLKDGKVSIADMTPNLRDMRQREPLNVPDQVLQRQLQRQGFLVTQKLLGATRDGAPQEYESVLSNAMRDIARYDTDIFTGIDAIAGEVAKYPDVAKEIFGIEVDTQFGGSYQPGSGTMIEYSEPEMIAERKRLINDKLVRDVYGAMAKELRMSLPTEHQQNSESLRHIENDIFERTMMLVDMDEDGTVNTQPLIEWGGWGTAVWGNQMIKYPKFEGYMPDLIRAGSLDLINGVANMFGAPDEDVRSRRERAEQYRSGAMQFVDDSSEMSWENYYKRTMGTMAEGAPFFMATFPLQIYTGGRLAALNMSTNGIIGVMAAESTAMLTMQEFARVKDNDEFKVYKKDGREYSYGDMIMATGGDPEKMAEYTAEQDVAAELGYIASAAGMNFAVDGMSSRFFMNALRSLPTHTLAGPQMRKWWSAYATNMGYAVPVGGVTSSIQAMAQYVSYQEATGREVDWKEVEEIGLSALPTGAAYGGLITTAGAGFNYFNGARALARDRFGRGMQNMTYLKQSEGLLSRLQNAKPEEALMIGREILELENLNLRRQLADTEFYRSMSAEDRENILIITDEMNQQRRLMLMLRDEESPSYKAAKERLEELAQQRNNIESLYEADPRPMRYDDDGNLLDRDPFAEGPEITEQLGVYSDPSAAPGYGARTPRPIEMLVPRRPKGLMYTQEGKTVYREQLEGDKPFYESLVDQYRGIENFQRGVQEREGLGLRVPEEMDVVAMMTLLEPRAQQAAMQDLAVITDKGGLFDIVRSGSRSAIGKGIDKITGRRTTQKLIDENAEALSGVMPEGSRLTPLSLFEQYRYALHANERNQHIYNKNKAEHDELSAKEGRTQLETERMRKLAQYMAEKKGSGMSDEQSQAFLDALPDELLTRLDEANGQLNGLVGKTQDALLKYGFINQEQYNTLQNQFENYTALFGRSIGDNTLIDPLTGEVRVTDDAYSKVRGQTYLDNKFLMEAKGRSEQTGDLLAKMMMQNIEVHVLGQRNLAMQRLHNLMAEYPDSQHRITDNGNSNAANTQVVYIDGQRKYLEFYHRDGTPNTMILQGLKEQPLDLGSKPTAGTVYHTMTVLSGLRKVHTNWSAEFGPWALFRDYVGAVQNSVFLTEQQYGYGLRTEDGMPVDAAAFQAGVLNPADVFKSWSMVALDATNLPKKLTGKDLAMVQEFLRAGGETGWISMQPLRKLSEQLEQATTQEAKIKWSETWVNKYGLELLEGLNGTFENAIRFNAYRKAREAGMSIDMAANIAKEISVNFNRKGYEGSQVGAVKYFFNPGIQGTNQFLTNMFTRSGMAADVDAYGNPVSSLTKMSPKFKAAGGLAALGSLATMWNIAMDYKDELGVSAYDQIPDWERYSRLSLLDPNGTDGERYGISLQYGYGLNYVFGVTATEMLMGRTNELDAALFMTSAMKHHIAPIYLAGPSPAKATEGESLDAGASEFLVSLIVPDFARGPVEIFANKAMLTGREIYRDDEGIPDSEEIMRGPEVLKYWMEDLNEWGGGSEHVSGDMYGVDLDFNTDPMWYLLESYLGSNLKAFEAAQNLQHNMKLESMDANAIQGFVTTDDMPFIRRFVKDNGGDDNVRRRFFEYRERMGQFKNEFQDELDLGKHIGKSQVYREQKMKEVGETSDDFRYLAYLSTMNFADAVYKVSYSKSEGLGLPRQLLIEKQKELMRAGLETDAQWEEYYQTVMDLQKLENASIALMTKFLKYAYIVSPPDAN